LKKLIPILLLIILPARMICAEGNPPLPEQPGNGYGIEPGTRYPGTAVLEMLEAAEDEAAAIAVEAFEAGYKEGRVDGAALWRPRYDEMAGRAARAEKRPKLLTLVLSVAGAFLIGAASGALVYGAAR
jgi:hypothetical protein